MIKTHLLGFPRIGSRRELKTALERHWRGELDEAGLEAVGRELRTLHWTWQRDAGIDFLSVGDFAFYDQVANHVQLFDCEPTRFDFRPHHTDLERSFTMARGVAQDADRHMDDCGCEACGPTARPALDMTK